MLNFLKLIVRYHLLNKSRTTGTLLNKTLLLIVHNHLRTAYFPPVLITGTHISHNKGITFAKDIGTRKIFALKRKLWLSTVRLSHTLIFELITMFPL